MKIGNLIISKSRHGFLDSQRPFDKHFVATKNHIDWRLDIRIFTFIAGDVNLHDIMLSKLRNIKLIQ